jgi:hypothetical protein
LSPARLDAWSDAEHDAVMRTTIDLPDDLHQAALQLARDRGQTLSRTVTELVRRAMAGGHDIAVTTDPLTGLPLIHLGRRITVEDVQQADDDDLDR